MEGIPFVDRAISNVVRAFFIVLGGVFSVAFGFEVSNQAPVVDDISVPQELDERGYTPTVVASRILSEWHTIAAVAQTTKTARNTRVPATKQLQEGQADLALPGLNVSIGALADYFKSKAGIRQDRLRGSIVISESAAPQCANTHCYTFFLTLNGQPMRTLADRPDIEPLLRDAARLMVENIDPYVLDNFYLHSTVDAEPDRRAEMQRLTTILLRSSSAEERGWANALQGVMLNRDHLWDQAIPYFDRALALDPNNYSAYNSRCWAKAHIDGQARSAIADCRAGLRINPRSEQTLDSLAYALEKDGQLDLAFKTIRCARRITRGADADIETTYHHLLELHPKPAPEPSDAECQGERLAAPPTTAAPANQVDGLLRMLGVRTG
ncbi:MAG TPA: tetratricopeptide repeat protein [Caulobacterales bacterium]|nr:tetratricopeptide repeat protein [Caulobacterales bacterium]